MVTSLEQERRLRDLFYAHYTFAELIERTGLPIDTILKVLNAPRHQEAPTLPASSSALLL
jgi:hypothetical protein